MLLAGGSYSARSIIASAVKCINYYPEKNPPDREVPFTLYQRPGLVKVPRAGDAPAAAPVRGLYRASNGAGYAVIGSGVFRILSDWSLRHLGEIAPGTSPVSMIDNRTVLLIVDGGNVGWQVALTGYQVQVTGNIYAGNTIDHLVGTTSTGTNGIPVGAIVEAPGLIPPATVVTGFFNTTTLTVSKNGLASVSAFYGSISGTTLTVDSLQPHPGVIAVGQFLYDDPLGNIPAGTKITGQLSGTPGGIGTYSIDPDAGTIGEEAMFGSSGVGATISFNVGEDHFAAVTDMSGIFRGASRVDYIDTYIIWNMPGGNLWGSTLTGAALLFDPTYFAAKTDYPDDLVSLVVNRHEILLLGALKSEIWYDAGNPTFPFAELPGAFVEHGLAAKYSVASADISVFWLGQDLQGQGVVFRQRGYQTTRISNHALEDAIRKISARAGISDAIGFTYQVDGHVFYVLTFPAGDETWVFDDAIGEPDLAWHQEAWTDQNGLLHRHRANCFAALYGKLVVGDWEDGSLYWLDLDTYTDDVGGRVTPITCVRSFQHLHKVSGRASPGPLMERPINGRRVMFNKFWLDLECGTSPAQVDGNPALIALRWSDDRGKTFGNDVLQSGGTLGEYLTQPQWPGLGVARDRIFEITHSIAGPAALNGAWVEGEILNE